MTLPKTRPKRHRCSLKRARNRRRSQCSAQAIRSSLRRLSTGPAIPTSTMTTTSTRSPSRTDRSFRQRGEAGSGRRRHLAEWGLEPAPKSSRRIKVAAIVILAVIAILLVAAMARSARSVVQHEAPDRDSVGSSDGGAGPHRRPTGSPSRESRHHDRLQQLRLSLPRLRSARNRAEATSS